MVDGGWGRRRRRGGGAGEPERQEKATHPAHLQMQWLHRGWWTKRVGQWNQSAGARSPPKPEDTEKKRKKPTKTTQGQGGSHTQNGFCTCFQSLQLCFSASHLNCSLLPPDARLHVWKLVLPTVNNPSISHGHGLISLTLLLANGQSDFPSLLSTVE